MDTIFIPVKASVSSFPGLVDSETLLSQQGMYAADFNFAYKNSIPVVQEMLDSIPQWYHDLAIEQGKELNVDIRVHELKKGDYPASPGWHVDASQRETAFQNNADLTAVEASLVGTISSHPNGVSNTIFVQNVINIDEDYEALTKNNNKLLQEKIIDKHLETVQTVDGVWTLFDPYTIHNIEQSKNDGVRLFARVSIWNKPDGHTPGLTKTEQVYRIDESY